LVRGTGSGKNLNFLIFVSRGLESSPGAWKCTLMEVFEEKEIIEIIAFHFSFSFLIIKNLSWAYIQMCKQKISVSGTVFRIHLRSTTTV
jgi:hypothetical protein